MVSCCFIAWIALVWWYLTRDRAVLVFTRKTLVPNKVFSVLLAVTLLFCLYCRLPLTDFVYLLLPVHLFSIVENLLHIGEKVRELVRDCIANYATMSFSFLLNPFLGLLGTSVLLFVFVLVFMDRCFLAAVFVQLSSCQAFMTRKWSKNGQKHGDCVVYCSCLFRFFPVLEDLSFLCCAY